MTSLPLSLSFFLRTLVTVFCLTMSIYQVSTSIKVYLGNPTSTTMEKGGLHQNSPLIWVCRKPGINMAKLEELGYGSLDDLRIGRWNGEGSLD